MSREINLLDETLARLTEEVEQELKEMKGRMLTNDELDSVLKHVNTLPSNMKKDLTAAAKMMMKDAKKGLSMANDMGASESESFFKHLPKDFLLSWGLDAVGDRI